MIKFSTNFLIFSLIYLQHLLKIQQKELMMKFFLQKKI